MEKSFLCLTSMLAATVLPMAVVRAQSDDMNYVHSRTMLDSAARLPQSRQITMTDWGGK